MGKWIRETDCEGKKVTYKCDACGFPDGWHDYKLCPMNEWIPVNDRLPDLFEVVLVTDECGNVFEYERRPLDDDGNVCDEWCFLGRNIIAWMPLPEPYKKGGKT